MLAGPHQFPLLDHSQFSLLDTQPDIQLHGHSQSKLLDHSQSQPCRTTVLALIGQQPVPQLHGTLGRTSPKKSWGWTTSGIKAPGPKSQVPANARTTVPCCGPQPSPSSWSHSPLLVEAQPVPAPGHVSPIVGHRPVPCSWTTVPYCLCLATASTSFGDHSPRLCGPQPVPAPSGPQSPPLPWAHSQYQRGAD